MLKGAAPLSGRPGALLPPADLEAERAQLQQKLPRPVTDEDLASYLMYPEGVARLRARARCCTAMSAILPTPVFFYGMEPGQEISVDIERGKTLIVRYVALSEPHEDGTRTVFFELNGQPRSVRVPDRSQVAKRPPQRKVEAGNAEHVGAPMPGTIATVAAAVGAQGGARRGAADARGDEDGDRRARGERRRGRRSAGAARAAGGCQGPAGGTALTC